MTELPHCQIACIPFAGLLFGFHKNDGARMKTYLGALDEIARYGGWWEVLKMRCLSAWIGIESRVMPKRSKARARALVRKP